MAFIIKDRVKEGTTSTGTGAVSLGGAAATFDTFQSYMTNGDTTYYAIVHTSSGVDEWEVGLGTWNTGDTLTRTTVLAGSNGTSAENFSAGTKDIFMTYPAAHAALAEDDVTFANISVTGTVDGRDVAADGTKLDTVEQNADVTDAVNVAAAGALMKSGGTMTGNLILNADPTAALGAATKEYVDTIASAGIHYHDPVRVETPSALTASYNNGSSGVGATLTNSGTQAALVIDGVTMTLNDRVLVYNQTDETHNGIYTVTNVGSASTNWVMTRATDADSYGASDPDSFGKGDAFFVKEGNTGAGELYVMTTAGTITFGTTAIHFSQVAETAVYNAGTGLTLTGTTFSIGQDVATSANVTFNQVTAAIIGNVTGNVTGDVTGNADTATALETARTIQLSGDVTGSATFDGSANINITAAVQDDSHNHVISNVDGLQAALDAKADDTTTITAGNGLTGGGSIGVNRTLNVGAGSGISVTADAVAHADTSTQASVNNSGRTYIHDITLDGFGHVTGLTSATETVTDTTYTAGAGLDLTGTTFSHTDTSSQGSVNNSNGTVIQDITLDTYGHITGLASVNLDGRYYTETEADSRFVNVTGDTMTGTLTLGASGFAEQLTVNRSDGNFHSVIKYANSTGELGRMGFTQNNELYWRIGAGGTSQYIFHDSYHPNADKWTTARTLSLSGDASGSVSWDGSANATLSVTVANDSHTHDGRYLRSGLDNLQVIPNIGFFTNDGGGNLGIRFNADTGTGTNYSIEDGSAWEFQFNNDTTSADFVIYRDVSISAAGEAITWQEAFRLEGTDTQAYLYGNKIFHDGYHPNADAWTTSRTLSLSGDASGSVSWDGSANATLSVTVANDSHTHDGRYYTESEADSRFVNVSGDTMTGQLTISGTSPQMKFNDTTSGADDFWIHCNDNNFYVLTDRDDNGSWDGTHPLQLTNSNSTGYLYGSRLFAENYHPNADKWTTARTLSLSGDASGSVSWDGSANATLSVTVANDSHSHSNYITSNANDNVSGHTEWQDNYEIRLGNGADFRMWHNGSNTYFRNYLHSDGDFFWQGEGTGGTNHNLISMHNDSTTPYVRLYHDSNVVLETVSGGVNIAGNTAWHAGNDGSGSGLDADLLDGNQGSYYLNYKGTNQNYVASSTSTSNRGSYGSGIWAYSGFSSGSNRPHTYDATLQVMPSSNLGFEISADWVSASSTPLKVRSLRDCCQGWSPWHRIATYYYASFGTSITSTGNITAYSSDERLKNNITLIESPLEKLQQLGGYTFDWDLDKYESLDFTPDNEHEHGLIAQEVQKVIPDAVTLAPVNLDEEGEAKTDDEYLTVRYDRLVPLLIEAIKEQQKQIDELKKCLEK